MVNQLQEQCQTHDWVPSRRYQGKSLNVCLTHVTHGFQSSFKSLVLMHMFASVDHLNPTCNLNHFFSFTSVGFTFAFRQMSSGFCSLWAAVLAATKSKSLSRFRYRPTSASTWSSCTKGTTDRSALLQTVLANVRWVELNPPDYIQCATNGCGEDTW